MKIYRSVIIVLLVLVLTGCGSTELEERCFPMLVAVGYEDRQVSFDIAYPKDSGVLQSSAKGADFAQSMEQYEGRLNKQIDYNHLRVLVFEDEFLKSSNGYSAMLDHLALRESFPRNTYVCIVDDVDELMELEKKLSQDLGTYLEEYLKQHEEKKDKLLTLGDLIDEKGNRNMIYYMPYIEVEDEYIEWNGYMNTKGKIWKDF